MTAIDPGIFKAYDIRGLYPSQLDAEVARRTGRSPRAVEGRREKLRINIRPRRPWTKS